MSKTRLYIYSQPREDSISLIGVYQGDTLKKLFEFHDGLTHTFVDEMMKAFPYKMLSEFDFVYRTAKAATTPDEVIHEWPLDMLNVIDSEEGPAPEKLKELRAKDPAMLGIPNINFSSDSILRVTDDRYETGLKERLARGFDYSETWSLTHTICSFLAPRLEEYIFQASEHIVIEPEEIEELKHLCQDLRRYAAGDEPSVPLDMNDKEATDTIEYSRFHKFPEVLAKHFFGLWW